MGRHQQGTGSDTEQRSRLSQWSSGGTCSGSARPSAGSGSALWKQQQEGLLKTQLLAPRKNEQLKYLHSPGPFLTV